MKKLLCVLIFSCLVLAGCLLFLYTGPASDQKNTDDVASDFTFHPSTNSSEKADSIITNDSTENNTTENDSSQSNPKTESVLLIGSSYFYYNNVPEMLYNFAAAGTSNNIEVVSCSLNGQTLIEHANAIKTIVRTEGDIHKLASSEKKYFHAEKSSGEIGYEDFLYERYAKIFWDYENNCPKHYSYIVLSPICHPKYGEGSSDSIAKSVSTIMNCIGTEDTSFVLHYTHVKMSSTLDNLVKEQAKQDKIYDKAIDLVKKDSSLSDKFSSLKAARAGKAYCNYMMYYGLTKAIDTEKEAYKIYKRELNRYGYKNDIYLTEDEHTTILGSYITAASIYEAMYGESADYVSAFDISENYVGKTTCDCLNLKFENSYRTNYGLFYNNGDGFKSKEICKSASFIVEQTQSHSMDFATKSDVSNWKKDNDKTNYNY